MLSFPFYRNGIEGIQNCLLRTLRVSSKKFLSSAWEDCVCNGVREGAYSGNFLSCGSAMAESPRISVVIGAQSCNVTIISLLQ